MNSFSSAVKTAGAEGAAFFKDSEEDPLFRLESSERGRFEWDPASPSCTGDVFDQMGWLIRSLLALS